LAKHPIVICLALCLIVGLIFTWPLALHFFSAIPYTLRPIQGFEQVPLMPGDHLQTYYWFWLLSDNLFGNSSLLTNPYEFNGPIGPMSAVYANFPFSLLYIILLFLGPIGAYNGLILLSFILCGLSMFLLAKEWTKDLWASLLAGLVFAAAPFRVSHIAGGQLPGYIIFLLPLCLFYIDRALMTGRWIYGGAGGLCLVLLSLMDPQTSYLTVLTLGLYLPSRILLWSSVPLSQGKVTPSLWPGFAGAFIGGLSISLFLWIRFRIKAGLPFWHQDMLQPFILGTMSTLLSWFYLSAFFSRLTNLSFAEARHLVGTFFFFFLPLGLYAFKNRLNISRLGLVLMVLCSSLFFLALIALWIKQRNRLLLFDRHKIIPVLTGIGLGLALAAAYLIHVRTTVFLPSLAGKGRTISEVLLFSPRVSNLFLWQDINQEKFILLGWGLVLPAVFGLLLLLKRHLKDPGQLALAGVLAFLGTILTLGPKLASFPLYQTLFQYFPFFNYSRVPARFIMVGLIFLCLLAGMALAAVREGLGARGWIRSKQWLPLLLIVLILAEYHSWQPLGLSLMTKKNQINELIEKRLSPGSRVLELPIWPGDSHQSSAYEYTVTKTRRPMVNGYAPVVFRDYIQQIFWPLYPLDQGEVREIQVQELKKLKVNLVTFHDNAQIYTEKVSPFPPRLALKRLIASPFLNLIDHDQDVFLFGFDTQTLPTTSVPSSSVVTSPVAALFYVNNLPLETGRNVLVPSASGYYLLMDEKALIQGKFVPRSGVRGNVALAVPGQDPPGYLVKGPSRFFPAGKYRARFRIQAGVAGPHQEVGRIELIKGQNTVSAQKILVGRDFIQGQPWMDIPLEFEISHTEQVGFRIYFSGKTQLRFNLAIIGFADQTQGPGSVEAEDLLRQTGTVVSDPLASGKEAVLGTAGFHPPIYLCYGPYRTFEPGKYKAKFFVRLKDPSRISDKTEVAFIEVATDMGKRVLAARMIEGQDLKALAFQPIEVDFEVPFRCELGYRVKFSGKADFLVDRISVE